MSNTEYDTNYQSGGPSTMKSGRLKGRLEHTYNKDSFKGHQVTKKFGGAGIAGERPESKHKLDLRSKRTTSDGYMPKGNATDVHPSLKNYKVAKGAKELKKSLEK